MLLSPGPCFLPEIRYTDKNPYAIDERDSSVPDLVLSEPGMVETGTDQPMKRTREMDF